MSAHSYVWWQWLRYEITDLSISHLKGWVLCSTVFAGKETTIWQFYYDQPLRKGTKNTIMALIYWGWGGWKCIIPFFDDVDVKDYLSLCLCLSVCLSFSFSISLSLNHLKPTNSNYLFDIEFNIFALGIWTDFLRVQPIELKLKCESSTSIIW